MEREDLWKVLHFAWEGKTPLSWVVNPALKSCSFIGNKWRSKKTIFKTLCRRHLALKPKTIFYSKLFFPPFLFFLFIPKWVLLGLWEDSGSNKRPTCHAEDWRHIRSIGILAWGMPIICVNIWSLYPDILCNSCISNLHDPHTASSQHCVINTFKQIVLHYPVLAIS